MSMLKFSVVWFLIMIAGVFIVTTVNAAVSADHIRYVREGGRGQGTSWKDASGDIQKMVNELSDIARNDWYNNKRGGAYQVWVGSGIYYGGFKMEQGVDVFGGFPATGTPDLEQRRPADRTEAYQVFLDGRMNKGTRVLTQTVFYDVKREVTWDGFTIQNGSVEIDASYYYEAEGSSGGGGGVCLVKYGCISNCIVRNNRNEYLKDLHINNWYEKLTVRGGGVFCDGGRIINCYVSNNTVEGRVLSGGKFPGCSVYGAGMYVKAGSVYNCVVTDNRIYSESKGTEGSGDVKALGAGVYVETGDFYNNTIVYNRAESAGGANGTNESFSGVWVSQNATMKNSILWGNSGMGEQIKTEPNASVSVTYSCIEGGYHGVANIQKDPKFKNSSDFHLTAGSPAINTGFNFPELPVMDLDCAPRIKDGAVDMGAYEYNASSVPLKRGIARMYVRIWEEPTVESDGSSWKKATSDLQGAIETMEKYGIGAKEIWVAQGEYSPVKREFNEAPSFVIAEGGIKIYGGFPDDKKNCTPGMEERNYRKYTSVLNGTSAKSKHVVYVNDWAGLETLIDGFTITGGNADGKDMFGTGAGLYVSEKSYGLEVNACIITGNKTVSGGSAVYAERFNMYNSLVFDNQSIGVIVKYTSFYNNTIVRNAAGGLKINTSSKWSEISNSVFWGNTGFQLDAGKVKYTYCAVEAEKNPDNGHNNIALASGNREKKGPYFCNPDDVTGMGFDLDCGSPLANIGDLSVKRGNLDLMGRPRVMFGKIDIGAMETDRGKAPEAPLINFPDTATCQYSPITVDITNSTVNGTVYWFHNGIAVGENSLVVDADVAGEQLYLAFHSDGAGCYSKADSVLVRVYGVETPVLTGADICEGENVLLTLKSYEAEANYFLKDSSKAVAPELYSEKEGVFTVKQPSVGEHSYQMYMTRNYGNGHVCTSQESGICPVTVSSGTETGDLELIQEGGAKDQSLCEGGAMVTVVYRYAGTSALADISEILPAGIKGVVWKVDADNKRVMIGGKPDQTFSYTIKVSGKLACQAAYRKGVITVNPLPRFELGE